jgi:hypothetical protein
MSSVVVVEMNKFNASIEVTELLMKTLENVASRLASRCISEVASRHGLNAEEEIRLLGLENLSLIRKQMAKKSVSKEKKIREPKVSVSVKKSLCPMPFIAEQVDIAGCQGLSYNRGLFTQCSKKRMENGNYCKGCQSEADKNASGCPDCGTVESRVANGLYDFKDPKGRSPSAYLKVLEKLKISTDIAIEEAGKLNIEIPNEHLILIKKKSKGRPSKKSGVVEADNVNDLFAKLSSEGEVEAIEEETEEKPVTKKSKAKLSDEEKEAKKAALEAERAAKKAEREAKIAQEKAEKEAKRKAEIEDKKAEREAKIAQEKAEREAKRAQEKAEREAKKAAEKAEKVGKSGKSGKAKKSPVANPVATPVATPAPEESKETTVTVSKIKLEGKTYFKSSTNILYDPETKEELGIWDPVTKTIKDLPDNDDEEEEEEYESEEDA